MVSFSAVITIQASNCHLQQVINCITNSQVGVDMQTANVSICPSETQGSSGPASLAPSLNSIKRATSQYSLRPN